MAWHLVYQALVTKLNYKSDASLAIIDLSKFRCDRKLSVIKPDLTELWIASVSVAQESPKLLGGVQLPGGSPLMEGRLHGCIPCLENRSRVETHPSSSILVPSSTIRRFSWKMTFQFMI